MATWGSTSPSPCSKGQHPSSARRRHLYTGQVRPAGRRSMGKPAGSNDETELSKVSSSEQKDGSPARLSAGLCQQCRFGPAPLYQLALNDGFTWHHKVGWLQLAFCRSVVASQERSGLFFHRRETIALVIFVLIHSNLTEGTLHKKFF